MTCDRCRDIHRAQREGKSNQSCGCSCHYSFSNIITQPKCICNSTISTTGICPVHRIQFQCDSDSGTIDVS